MSFNLKEMVALAGANVGVEVHEVTQHPSGAYVLHTSVGKGYLPDDTNIEDPASFADAVHMTLSMMKEMADGVSTDSYVLTGEQMETCLDALAAEQTTVPESAPKTKRTSKTKTPVSE